MKSTVFKLTNSTLKFYHLSQNIRKTQTEHCHTCTLQRLCQRELSNVTFESAKMIVQRNRAKQQRHRGWAGKRRLTLDNSQHWSWPGTQYFIIILLWLLPQKTFCPQSSPHCYQPFHQFQQKVYWASGLSFRHAGSVLTSAVLWMLSNTHLEKQVLSIEKNFILVTIAFQKSQKHKTILTWKTAPRSTVTENTLTKHSRKVSADSRLAGQLTFTGFYQRFPKIITHPLEFFCIN